MHKKIHAKIHAKIHDPPGDPQGDPPGNPPGDPPDDPPGDPPGGPPGEAWASLRATRKMFRQPSGRWFGNLPSDPEDVLATLQATQMICWQQSYSDQKNAVAAIRITWVFWQPSDFFGDPPGDPGMSMK